MSLPSSPSRRARRGRPLPFFRFLTKPFLQVPSRVFGHLLVVVVCLGVAYAGRTTPLSDRLGGGGGQSTLLDPSALAAASVAPADALSPVPNTLTQAATPQRMQIMHYDVQSGDTVASLANRFDISENTIRWTNRVGADGTLTPGQQLVILPVSGVLYAVHPGDTVDGIAQRFQSDGAAIVQVNQIVDSAHLKPGAQVIVPGGRIPEAPTPLPSASPVAASVPAAASAPVVTSVPAVSSVPSATSVPAARPPEGLRAAPTAERPLLIPPPVVAPVFLQPDPPIRIPYLDRFLSPPVIAPPAPVPAPSAPKPLAPIVYHVAAGDTLSTIATKFGVSPESIAFSSGIQGNADSLTIDEKLVIPPVPGVVHVVQAGDTLRGIAERYSVDPLVIAKANGLSDPFVVQPGQSVVVPGGKVPEVAPAPTAAPEAPAPTPVPATTYAVKEGDSLAGIADSFGVEIRQIIDANGLADPYVLQPGQQLVIPGDHPVQHTASTSTGTTRAAAAVAPAPVAESRPEPVVAKPTPRPVEPRPTPVPARPTPAPAPPPSSSGGWGIVAIASKYLGYPYVWGGTSPSSGFDCSGFVYYVYRAAGNPVPRDMWGQLQSGTRVSMANLKPGDIVFFANTYQAGLSHDGIYIGGGRFIHAADYGIGIEVSSLSNAYYAAHYFGATRP